MASTNLDKRGDNMPHLAAAGGGGGGSVNSVTAADPTIAIGGTAADPTVAVGTLTPGSNGVPTLAAADATMTVGGSATARTVAVGTLTPGSNGTLALATTGTTDVSLTASAVGVGATAAKNDHNHALDQTIAPTWTGSHTWSTSDNGTTTVTRTQIAQHRNNAAGAPAATYGVGQLFKLDSAARNLRTAVQMDAVWIVATDAAESAQLQFYAITAGSVPSTAALTIDGVSCAKGLITDAGTNTSTVLATLDHRSTGTSSASYGAGILLRGQDASASAGGDDLIQLDGIFTTATSGAEVTAAVFKTRAAGGALAESFRVAGGATGTITIAGAATITAGSTMTVQSNSGLAKLKSGSTAGTCAITPGAADTYNARGVTTSGTTITNEFTGIAHTGQTTTAESPEFKITMPTKTWAAGTIASQAFLKVTAPTIAFASASTATICTTAEFAAPVAGSNATITDGYSSVFKSKIRVESAVALGGGAAPTVGTIGGSGPATAAQNEWIAIDTQNGRRFVPAWA